MKKLILIALLFAVGCIHDGDIRPDCKHWSVMGAYTIKQATGQEPRIACGMGQMREAQWFDTQARTGIVMSPHAQVVTIDKAGDIVEWWKFDGVCWRPSHQELATVDKLVTLDEFIDSTIPR